MAAVALSNRPMAIRAWRRRRSWSYTSAAAEARKRQPELTLPPRDPSKSTRPDNRSCRFAVPGIGSERPRRVEGCRGGFLGDRRVSTIRLDQPETAEIEAAVGDRVLVALTQLRRVEAELGDELSIDLAADGVARALELA
jgi:hypothetical protein